MSGGAEAGGERLFDGDLMRATVFAPGRGRLVVTFRSRVATPGAFGDPAPVRSFVARGWTHLHLQSRWNDWYVNAETEALSDRLSAFAAAYPAPVAFGFSMGGYAALRYARALRLAQAVLVSPQVSIDPDAIPFDRRFRAEAQGFDPVLGDLARHGQPDLRGVLLFDPLRLPDRGHAEMIEQIHPQLALCRLAGGGHPATGVIRGADGFGALQRLVLHGGLSRQAVLALHRPARPASAAYWRNLAEAAALRGRPGLAVRARGRAAGLPASD